jgi:hypothetical protein
MPFVRFKRGCIIYIILAVDKYSLFAIRDYFLFLFFFFLGFGFLAVLPTILDWSAISSSSHASSLGAAAAAGCFSDVWAVPRRPCLV